MVTAANNVEAAKEELVQAREHQKRSSKCLLYLIIGCVIALAIILIIIFAPKK